MKSIIGFSVLVFMSVTAQARDLYNFHSLGFSPKGQYYAFAESVEMDGSGFHAANVSVVEVTTNKLVAYENVVLKNNSATEAQALKKVINKINLSKFGIGAEADQGEMLLVRTRTDYSEYKDTVFTTYYYRAYALAIEATPASGFGRCTSPELLKLSLAGADDGTKDIQRILQADTVLPKSRGCAFGYKVARVIRKGDALIVIVTYSNPGFEGSDLHHMAVGSKIDLP